ncbi:uncharacterized protein C7orf50 homolog isoform X2 [Anopheles coustani]|uniref:uncharacterized protein C7orf50 homolog isoform X2 n=1 Tax=Anopheles coustani TaxID=139045 RepID=UPI00265AE01B|nr:uncharacterized protein C7orf50 homolog isoform X2 [Anopheles coustani]
MVKKVKTKNVADAAEAKVAAVPIKKKIVKPVPSTKVSPEDKKVKPVKNGADANTNGTAKGLKKAQKLKEKVEGDGVVPQNEEHVAVKNRTSKTPVTEGAKESVVSGKVQSVAEEKPETPGSNRKKNKLKRKNEVRVQENGVGEAAPVKKARKANKNKKKPASDHEIQLKHLANRIKIEKIKKNQVIINYLNAWKDRRENWKFEKKKQIYIQANIFDEQIIDATMFPIAVEYLSAAKGKSLTDLLVAARFVVQDIDAAPDADASAKESSRYQRAREVLQSLG